MRRWMPDEEIVSIRNYFRWKYEPLGYIAVPAACPHVLRLRARSVVVGVGAARNLYVVALRAFAIARFLLLFAAFLADGG